MPIFTVRSTFIFSGVKLYHGWLVDPQDEKLFCTMSKLYYNKSVEVALDENSVESFVVKEFLQSTSNQLTYHGLFELTSHLGEDEVAVFFRNNHFSTITKYEGALYQLVTDQGFLKEDSVVWESLSSVSGDNDFTNSFFKKTSHLQAHRVPLAATENSPVAVDSLTDDYQLALKLENDGLCQNDETIARRLQEEEEQQQLQETERERSRAVEKREPAPRPRRRSPCVGGTQPRSNADNERGSSCSIL